MDGVPRRLEDRLNELEATMQENFRFLARSADLGGGSSYVDTELENHSVQIKTMHQQMNFLVTQVVQLRKDMDSAQADLARASTAHGLATLSAPAAPAEPKHMPGVSTSEPGRMVTVKDLNMLEESLNQALAKKLDAAALMAEVEVAVKYEVNSQMKSLRETGTVLPNSQQVATATGTQAGLQGVAAPVAAPNLTMEVQQQRMMALLNVLARQNNSLAKQLADLGGKTASTGNVELANSDARRTAEANYYEPRAGEAAASFLSTDTSIVSVGGGDNFRRPSGYGVFGGGWRRDEMTRSDGAMTMSQLMEVDCSQGESLGLELDITNADYLVVNGIRDGLIKGWNRANREDMITCSDRIIQVNDVRGRGLLLLQELQANKKLRIKYQRTQTSV